MFPDQNLLTLIDLRPLCVLVLSGLGLCAESVAESLYVCYPSLAELTMPLTFRAKVDTVGLL